MEKFVLMHCKRQGISGQAHGSDAPRSVTFVIVIDNSNIETRIQGDKSWRSMSQSSIARFRRATETPFNLVLEARP
jgi:hypothetical protein